ncbi:hypothetical protein G9G63_10290 [Paenibacillus sp. EKM202P]|uniref:hypothetical protein n=1 Tax=unclassified Paenibacillus TaxID=185978 RepID=UPI0013EC1C28|nr:MULTISPECIES: hypothetical protein [unclassified Paenibacillus]KAF6564522.1 hypothetical protein G9G63_10290 [Paenibacillus sp. EKM202P]KAF6571663.1 hypothetical protein G9G64_06485 [Paenibacillus sp. EKM207P]
MGVSELLSKEIKEYKNKNNKMPDKITLNNDTWMKLKTEVAPYTTVELEEHRNIGKFRGVDIECASDQEQNLKID